MKTRKPEKEPSVTQEIEGTGPCPFCGEARLAPSPSGKHSVCMKCGRIVLRPRPHKPAGRKPA